MIRVLLLNVLICMTLWSADSADPFDDKTFTPSVTGLVITQFVPESQAEKLGLRIGDIITSYAGKPLAGPTDLLNAVQANTADALIVAQRGQEAVTITAKPGKLGVYSTFVEGGKVLSLPPDTAVMFSLERLKKSPLDTWYHFIIDGKKVGAEHARLELVGNHLTITIEVLFDGGERWGLNHMIETGVLDVSGSAPRVVTQVHEGPLTGFRSTGRWKDATVSTGISAAPTCSRLWRPANERPAVRPVAVDTGQHRRHRTGPTAASFSNFSDFSGSRRLALATRRLAGRPRPAPRRQPAAIRRCRAGAGGR